MSSVINSTQFWQAVVEEVISGDYTLEQKNKIRSVGKYMGEIKTNVSKWMHLDIKKVDGILAITASQVDDSLQLIINGKWLRLAIEEDGYMVFTSSELTGAVTG